MLKNNRISENTMDEIADGLQHFGFILLQNFLSDELATTLYSEARTLSKGAFKPAGIGRTATHQVSSAVRTDSTLWLSQDSLSQRMYLDCMEQLRVGLNRRLYLRLNDFECHFSHYARGQFYKRHLDAFTRHVSDTRNHRFLSSVFYLNPSWQIADAGELVLYPDELSTPLLTVSPILNHCVLFLSDTFPHEVLPSKSDRYSIAGWYRTDG